MAIYMKIDGINGEVTAKGHEKWIDVTSMQWGVGRSIASAIGSSMNREASKPSISEVNVTKPMDQSSPYLFTEAVVGKGKKVQIHLCTAGKSLTAYMEYELEDCMISGYSVSGSGDDRPHESLSLSFTKLTMTFIEQDKDGNPTNRIPAVYNMVTGEPG